METVIYINKDIEVVHDLREDLYYLSIVHNSCVRDCTKDYTNQELVTVLKDMISVLEN